MAKVISKVIRFVKLIETLWYEIGITSCKKTGMPYIIHFPFLKYDGLTLFPFILLKKKQFKNDLTLINHESIHLRQQLEMLVVPFYLIYFFHYLINLVISGSHEIAYRNIVFEREAYDNANNPSYLHKRRAYSFINYL